MFVRASFDKNMACGHVAGSHTFLTALCPPLKLESLKAQCSRSNLWETAVTLNVIL